MFMPPWLITYQKDQLSGDIVAGIIVSVVLVPQAIAYGMLAGLPPEVALYSSILPLILYAAFGSSNTLAVGPVGLMSLMTGTALLELNLSSTEQTIAAAHTLAFLVGILLLTLKMIRLSGIINFLSHPVTSGFISASAIIIILSQLKNLLGLSIPRGLPAYETAYRTLEQLPQSNIYSTLIGLLGLLILWLFKAPLTGYLKTRPMNSTARQFASKSGPLLVVALSTFSVYYFSLNTEQLVTIIGHIPAGLPSIQFPDFSIGLVKQLLPNAFVIALIGYLESVSIAKSMASQRREKISASKELQGLGAANIAASISGGFPVAGGFGRSMVNFSSGANTPLASVITAGLVTFTLLSLTPLFFFLPKAILAAIIIVAVVPLINIQAFKQAWRYDKTDALSLLVTFFTVLIINVETGLICGAAISVGIYLHRSTKPHIAVVGQVGNTEHYRNIDRHSVKTDPRILAIRIDENLYFANTNYLEDRIMQLIADKPAIDHVVLICSSISIIDTSALESLESIHHNLEKAAISLHLAEIKGPVMDRLKGTPFIQKIGQQNIFLSTHQAMRSLRN